MCQPRAVASFQRWNRLPKKGRPSMTVPGRRQACPRHTEGTGSGTKDRNATTCCYTTCPPLAQVLLSQKPQEQPNYPVSLAQVQDSGNSVGLRPWQVECVHVYACMCARSELVQALLLSAHHRMQRIPQTPRLSREGTYSPPPQPLPASAPPERKPGSGVEQCSPTPPSLFTLRHPGWMISLQMEHSMSMRLNLPSSSSTVSSFPASPHTRHTAVWGSTGCRVGRTQVGMAGTPRGTDQINELSPWAFQEPWENQPRAAHRSFIQSNPYPCTTSTCQVLLQH